MQKRVLPPSLARFADAMTDSTSSIFSVSTGDSYFELCGQ
jgi:hypothetical protein